MRENGSLPGALRAWLSEAENRLRVLCTLRYLLPLLWALLLLVLGFFYNIRAGRLGRLSLWHLLFNTVKQARAALLTGQVADAARSYYVLLLVGAFLAALAALAALIFALFALYTYVIATGRRSVSECRRAKILFRAVFPNRAALLFSNLLLLLPALFPLYFSIVSNRHPGGGFITLGFDPVLTVSLVMALLLTVLSLYLVGRERHSALDMLDIGPEDGEEVEDSEGDDDGEGDDDVVDSEDSDDVENVGDGEDAEAIARPE